MKDKLIQYLTNEIWFRTGPSSIHGVGLFAIRDIPKGTDIMVEFDGKEETIFRTQYNDWYGHTSKNLFSEETDFQDIHPNVKQMWNDYWPNDDTWQYIYLPPTYKRSHLYYLNHSDNPCGYPNSDHNNAEFITSRDIKEGEEITVDYNQINKYIYNETEETTHNPIQEGKPIKDHIASSRGIWTDCYHGLSSLPIK